MASAGLGALHERFDLAKVGVLVAGPALELHGGHPEGSFIVHGVLHGFTTLGLGGHLVPMIQQARENLGVAAQATVTLADTGYGAGADLAAAAQHGMAVLVPPAEGTPAKDNPYATQHFHYDAARQRVTCPQQRTLDHEGHTTKDGVRVERYRCHHRDCPVRAECTRDPKGRQLEVRPHTAVVQAMLQSLAAPLTRAQWRERSTIIEPRFGQLKQHDGFRRWTVWGLEGVKTQWALLCATLNLRVLYARWRASRPPEGTNPAARAIPMAQGTKLARRAGLWAACAWEKVSGLSLVWNRPQRTCLPVAFAPVR